MDETKILISIIVPVFNEEENIETTYRELVRVTDGLSDYRFEFIFTDNRSTDMTFARLLHLVNIDPRVRVARFSRNFGFDKSVLTGYRLSSGEAAIQIDADLQDPPEIFAAFLEKWREGYDVVVGMRRNRVEPMPLQKARRFYYRLMSWLDGPHLIPDAGDFRLIDKSIVQNLRQIEDAHPYLRGLISSLARRQTGVAFDRRARLMGKSKYPVKRLLGMGLHGVMTHSRAPLKVAFYLSGIVSIVALLLIAVFLFSRIVFAAEWPAGLATTHILLLMGIALNSLFTGILGAYIGRIYDQVRTRPATVVSDLVNFPARAAAGERSIGAVAESFDRIRSPLV